MLQQLKEHTNRPTTSHGQAQAQLGTYLPCVRPQHRDSRGDP